MAVALRNEALFKYLEQSVVAYSDTHRDADSERADLASGHGRFGHRPRLRFIAIRVRSWDQSHA